MHNWHITGMALITTAIVYAYLLVAVRVLGRKTLSQLHPIDLIVLLLLGSAVETAMVGASTLLRVGLVSASVLLLMNFLLNRLMLKSKRFRHLVNGGPILLVHDGVLCSEHARKVGLTEADILQALRAREIAGFSDVRFAVLEPDGRINVVRRSQLTAGPTTA